MKAYHFAKGFQNRQFAGRRHHYSYCQENLPGDLWCISHLKPEWLLIVTKAAVKLRKDIRWPTASDEKSGQIESA
jgi:hypothetical protein